MLFFETLVRYAFKETSKEENEKIEDFVNIPENESYKYIIKGINKKKKGFQNSKQYIDWAEKRAKEIIHGTSTPQMPKKELINYINKNRTN